MSLKSAVFCQHLSNYSSLTLVQYINASSWRHQNILV